MVSKQILFSTYFYQSLQSVVITRTYYNITNFLTDIGGFASAVFALFSFFGNVINRHFLIQKISRAIFYFTKVYSDPDLSPDSIERETFTFSTAIERQKRSFMKIICCRKGKLAGAS